MINPKFIPGSGPANARIVIVGEAPGKDEVIAGTPFVGESGKELDKMLAEAGIARADCYVTNVIKFRPDKNNIEEYITEKKKVAAERGWTHYNGRFVSPMAYDHIQLLHAEIAAIGPNVVITVGDTAMWALTGKSGITLWRGSVLEGVYQHTNTMYKVIPTYHPAAILRMWEWRDVAVQDMRRALRESYRGDIAYPKNVFHLRPSFSDVMEFLGIVEARLLFSPADHIPIAVDIETRQGHIACLGIAISDLEAICIPFMCVENIAGYWTEAEECAIIWKLQEILTHHRVEVIGQNFIYDTQYIVKHWGFVPNVVFDTMLAHHVCYPALPKALHFLASLYCNFYQYWKEEGKNWDPKVPEEQLWAYNCRDAVATFEVAMELRRIITQMNLDEVFKFQMSLFMPVLRMMLRGVKIDHKLRASFALSLAQASAERQDYLNTATGQTLNIRSPQQLIQYFYTDCGIKPVLKRRITDEGVKWTPTTDDDALKKIGRREILMQPICNCISDMRSISVYHSTFVTSDFDIDNRLRCSYNIAGTKTFRFNSSEDAFGFGMNMQNIPQEDKERKEKEERNKQAIARGQKPVEFILPNIRRMIIPDTDHVIMDWDLDRADLQVVVWEAKDEGLRKLLKEGLDLHLANAQVLFNLPYTLDNLRDPAFLKTAKAKYSFQRQMAKIFCHGTNYGGSPRTMAEHCEVSVKEAEEMHNRWFLAHPEIKAWHRKVMNMLRHNRTVTNKFGYHHTYFEHIEGILPEALAWIPQSTVACTINRGLKNIDEKLPHVHLLLQVHDSLVMQTPAALARSTNTIAQINECLKITIPYDEPLVIPTNCKISAVSWGDVDSLEKWSGLAGDNVGNYYRKMAA